MNILSRPATAPRANNISGVNARVFGVRPVQNGAIIRRSIREVESDIGRDAFMKEVRARGFHLVECGNHFVIICHRGNMRVHF